ncbi:hypothetical protein DFH28DRAFT_1139579 [Melampsora americana]|nr:hypothetical protein DFH28DRAFT_1139579 [Melampsora americana]
MANLKWKEGDVVMLEGELVRDKIRLIQIPLEFPSNPGNNVQRFFPPKSTIDNLMIPQTLVYSNSQNETLDIHRAIHVAREDENKRFNGSSSLICQFHAVTGSKDKQDHINVYGCGEVAIMACTMALGMGSNWPQTCQVITIGRMDPSVLGQMVGCAGRDGRPAVGIMLVETKRSSGKNQPSDFVNPSKMTNDDHMDALTITPVCLCIAFQVNNMIGHIALSPQDLFHVKEKQMQQDKGIVVTASRILPSPVTNGWKTPDFNLERTESTSLGKIVTFLKWATRDNFCAYLLEAQHHAARTAIAASKRESLKRGGNNLITCTTSNLKTEKGMPTFKTQKVGAPQGLRKKSHAVNIPPRSPPHWNTNAGHPVLDHSQGVLMCLPTNLPEDIWPSAHSRPRNQSTVDLVSKSQLSRTVNNH